MVETIDAFAHVFPKPLYERMRELHPTDELRGLDGKEYFWEIQTRIEDMNEFGIDRQVLTLARPPIWRGMSSSTKLQATKAANDALAEYAARRPDRFIPVGTIPGLTEAYAAEAERCVADLGMAGIQLFSNVEGNPIDSRSGEAILGIVNDRDAGVWLHPQLHRWHEWDGEFLLNKMLGWPFDTSLALARLVFSGIMERYPDLQVIPHHMGGMIPHFAERIELVANLVLNNPDLYPVSVPELSEEPLSYFKRFYADTVRGGSSRVLEDGVRFYGEDRVVFATDYPFGPDNGRHFLETESAAVDSMDVDRETRTKIKGGNIRSVLNG